MEEGIQQKRWSKEAEQSLLGAMMIPNNEEAIEEAQQHLPTPAMLWKDSHQTIYRTILELTGQGKPCDATSVGERLDAKQRLSDVGGSSYLADLMNVCPDPSAAAHYAKIVKDRYYRRETERTLRSEDIYDLESNPEKIIEEKISDLEQIQEQRSGSDITSLADGFNEMVTKIEEAAENEGLMEGAIKFGIPPVTDRIHGIAENDLIVISGPSKSGKTTLALQTADFVAEKYDSALIYTGEMHDYEIAIKLTAKDTGITMDALQEGRLDDDDWAKITNCMNRKIDSGLVTIRQPHPTIYDFKSAVRKAKRKHDIDLVVLDYLHLFRNHDPATLSRTEFLNEVSSQLMDFTNEQGVPIITIARENREGQIYGTTEMRYDCNYHFELRDVSPDNDDDNRKVLDLSGARMSRGGDIPLMFDGEHSCFYQKGGGSDDREMSERAKQETF